GVIEREAERDQGAEAVADEIERARVEAIGEGFEIGRHRGEIVARARALALAVTAEIVEQNATALRERGGGGEGPRREASHEEAMEHHERRRLGLAELLDVERDPARGDQKHFKMCSTKSPTVRARIASSSIPASQPAKSTRSP